MSYKGTSLNATAENLQRSVKVKTKKKPTPRVKGISLNTIKETQTRTRTKKKPPPKSKGLFLSIIEEIQSRTRTKKKPPPSIRSRKPKQSLEPIDLDEDNPNSQMVNDRKNASKKVGSFMIKHRSKIRLTFLNTICSDSNVCIAFGKETKTIRKFFNDFDLNLISKEPKMIGVDSTNGTVQLLTFERDGYVANAIFKTSNRESADNLAYEALVGKFINKQKLRFPCFLETYGLYYNGEPDKSIAGYKKIDINKESLLKSCDTPLSVGIMIENIKEGYTLETAIMILSNSQYRKQYVQFMNSHLLYILYQIYAPLSILSDVFTHYDLHENNVMLYPVETGKYIEYNYHYPDHTVTFNSSYIVKIIDYGRCFFKDEKGYNPQDAYKDLCRSKSVLCRDCGEDSGFEWLGPMRISYISSSKRNMSHDLRLLKLLQSYLRIYNDDLINLIFSVRYITDHGTPELTSENDNRILNVNEAKRHLERLMENDFFKKINVYSPSNKLGVMHIYSYGRPMEYISV